MIEFKPFPKMARLSREVVVSEKIDGSNASILLVPVPTQCDGQGVLVEGSLGVFEGHVVFAGSRNRWIQPGNDNYGFAAWVRDNVTELLKLGPGRHDGEWFGAGIQRNYGLKEKRFSLFNIKRWVPDAEAKTVEERGTQAKGVKDIDGDEKCACVGVVPVLYRGEFNTDAINQTLEGLRRTGSIAAPGFPSPEGIVIFHTAAGIFFKKTFDDSPKNQLDKL